MKRIMTWILAALMLLSVTSCSFETTEKDVSIGEKVTKQEQKEVSIEEQVCFTYEGLTVTAKKMKHDRIWGDSIEFLIENEGSKTVNVGVDSVTVNHCKVSDLFSCDCAPGKKATEDLTFSSSDLENAGIKEIGVVEVSFYLYDDENYRTIYEAPVVTLKTSLYDEALLTPPEAGVVLVEEMGVRISAIRVDSDSLLGASVIFFVQNDTDRELTVSADDVSVNGFMIQGIMSESVPAGRYAYPDMTLFSSDLEKNGITQVDEVELSFRVYDSDTWKDLFKTVPIAVTFQ